MIKLQADENSNLITFTYTSSSVTFNCNNCGTQCTVKKGTPNAIMSATFCKTCDEQYWIRWSEGVLRKGAYVMKWSEMSHRDRVQLLLQHVIPHDMGDDLVFVFENGDIITPKGKRPINYPIAAWDDALECWWTRDIGSNGATIFDPLCNMHAAWQVVEEMTKISESSTVDRQLRAIKFAIWWEKANLWAMSSSAAADLICYQSLRICGVEIEP